MGRENVRFRINVFFIQISDPYFADCKKDTAKQSWIDGNSTARTNVYFICSMCIISENIYHVITFI